ncbi:MAG: Fic family protein [Chloroflexi bacterium]|nr:Fic family protein [Chloroflexota bacterium]
MRTYERTHPWTSFSLDLKRFTYLTWMFLGEAQSKCSHVAGVPLLPKVAEHLHRVFLAKGVRATTAIEGNTLSEQDVLRHLEGKLTLTASKEYLAREVDNIIQACNTIGDEVLTASRSTLTVEQIQEFNRIVLNGLTLADEVTPGQFRAYPVTIGPYRGAPYEDIVYLTAKLCDWLTTAFASIPQLNPIALGILKAIAAHLYIAWIHPFGDGNGRTARLVEFQILLSSGVPTTAAHLLSNHYNQTRAEYYRHLDQASRSPEGVYDFFAYALQGFVDGLQEEIELIQYQQLTVHWENYVHDSFKNRHSMADERRRRLALDLSRIPDDKPRPIPTVRHVSPRIAEAYAHKTDKTVRRDLNELQRMDLIRITPEGIIARREKIRAFLPRVIRGSQPSRTGD